MNIVERPTNLHLKQVHEWLKAEHQKTGKGFLCNWEVIQSAYKEGNMWVVELDSSAVALLVYSLGSTGKISLLTVQLEFRRIGIGKILATSIIDRFREYGVKRVMVQSEPKTSEPFWLALGFIEEEGNICERINGIPMQNLNLYKDLL